MKKYRILPVLASILVGFVLSCSFENKVDVPNAANSDGKGDGTNTLRYQNRTVK